MEEAVIRIVLDSSGAGSSTPGGGASTGGDTTSNLAREAEQLKSQVERLKSTRAAVAAVAMKQIEQAQDWMQSLINPAEGANPHVLLEGQSGSGKSLAAKHIAFERMKLGHEVSVVDTHNPEAWGGAKNVFQGTNEQAGTAAAEFLRKSLESRKEEASAAKMRGEVPDFKPMTIVFSDFARLMKDTPQLGEEFKTLLTEARKFRISIVADTTALTGASSGIKGIQDVLQNFGQKVKFFAPTPQGDPRRAEVAGKTYDTPKLPDYKERVDYGLVKPPPPPKPEVDTSGDSSKMVANVINAGVVRSLAAVVPVVGALAAAVAATVLVIKRLNSELNREADTYSNYNPNVAQAEAMAELRRTINDMRRANESGSDLSKFIEAQSKASESWEDFKLRFMESIMPLMEGLMEFIEVALPVLQVILTPLEMMLKFLSWIYRLGKEWRDGQDTDMGNPFDFDPRTDINSVNVGLSTGF
jgi:hypothetical protein